MIISQLKSYKKMRKQTSLMFPENHHCSFRMSQWNVNARTTKTKTKLLSHQLRSLMSMILSHAIYKRGALPIYTHTNSNILALICWAGKMKRSQYVTSKSIVLKAVDTVGSY